MEDWEKKIEALLHGEQQQQEDRTKKVQKEDKAKDENRKKAVAFVQGVPLQAFKELEQGLQKQNLRAYVTRGETGTSLSIEVERQGEGTTELKRFEYTIETTYTASEVTPQVSWRSERKHVSSHRILRAGSMLAIDEITKKDIIEDFTEAFESTFTK